MKLSGVMPIHNEEAYLPYSLHALRKASINELVIVLDRCTDKSESIIQKFARLTPYPVKIIKKSTSTWRNPGSEAFELGIKHSSGDIIYVIGADLLCDHRIFDRSLWEDETIGTLSFRYWHYQLYGNLWERIHPIYENILMKVLSDISPYKQNYHSGLYACRSEVWDKIHLKDVPSEYDVFLKDVQHLLIKGKSKVPVQYDDFLERTSRFYKHRFIMNVNNIHLRAGLTRSRQILQGISRFYSGYPLWKVIAHMLLHLKLYVFWSYWKTKKGVMFTKWKK